MVKHMYLEEQNC